MPGRLNLVPHSIAGRLLLIELLAGLPALVLFGYWLLQVRHENRQQAHDAARRAVQVVVGEHEAVLDTTRRLLAEIAPEIEISAPQSDCTPILQRVRPRAVQYRELAVVDSAGDVLCHAGSAAAAELTEDSTWWRAARALHDPIVRYSFVRGLSPPAAVVLAGRVIRLGGSADRVVFATIDLEWMNQQGAIAALPSGSALTMVDGTGRILVRHPNPQAWVGSREQDSDLIRSMAEASRGTVEAEGLDGVRRVYVFEPLPGGATIRAGIPSAVVYAQYQRAQRPVIIAVVSTILIAFLLSRTAAHRLILRRAEALSRAANALREGQLSARTGVTGQDELARTAVAFDEMADKLQDTVGRLQELARRSEAALEEDRKRISRTIHDELGQVLTALQLELVRTLPSAANQDDVRQLIHQVEAALERVRTAALELRPTMLDDLGLCAAVEWQVQEFGRRTGINCDVETDPAADEIEPDVATAIFRILQEALTNVARHAQARAVHVALARQDGMIVLDVVDDGRGLPAERKPTSLGLLSMTERARAVGGAVELRPAAPRGTQVQARVPASPP
jgi:signal transduction histidine kinase